jgi:hypothetical protein
MDYSYSYSVDFQGSPVFMVIWALMTVFYIYCGWKLFTKAGQPGWAAIIPIYNFFVLLKIIGKPAWWFILMLIPFVNFIIAIIITNQLSARFGKGVGYTLGLLFLGFIFMPVLALGSSKYTPPSPATV